MAKFLRETDHPQKTFIGLNKKDLYTHQQDSSLNKKGNKYRFISVKRKSTGLAQTAMVFYVILEKYHLAFQTAFLHCLFSVHLSIVRLPATTKKKVACLCEKR